MTQFDHAWIQTAGQHPKYAFATAAIGLAALCMAFMLARALITSSVGAGKAIGRTVSARTAGVDRADLLTYVAASIATAVSAQGMWRFFRDVLRFEAFLRIGVFGFIEIAVLASAVRARRSVRDNGAAGIDGVAVWVLTALTGILSALHATSFAEAVFRLAAPLVAAWLWERGMGVERRRVTGRTGIHWRITPERVLVRLGLAEASDRTAGQVDVDRRLTRLALTVAALREGGPGVSARRRRRLTDRVAKSMRAAVKSTDLATDPAQQGRLIAALGALTNAEALVGGAYAPPWNPSALSPPSALPASDAPDPDAPSAPPEPDEAAPDSASDAHADPDPSAPDQDDEERTSEDPQPEPTPDSDRSGRPTREILEALEKLDQLPSIRAIARDQHVSQKRAKVLREIEELRRNQSPITSSQELKEDQIKINSTHQSEAAKEDQILYTPMQRS